MYRYLYIILLSFIVASVQAFFIHKEKEPLIFCLKVCPLYCSPRRRDDDASSLIYIDDHPYTPYHYDHEIPYHFDPYYFWKPPKPTTTPPAPTTMKTTTAEPSGLCMICMNKCRTYSHQLRNNKYGHDSNWPQRDHGHIHNVSLFLPNPIINGTGSDDNERPPIRNYGSHHRNHRH